MQISYSTQLMRKFSNIIYNFFLSKLRKIKKSYYIRGYGENRKDLTDFCNECMKDDVLKGVASQIFHTGAEVESGRILYDRIAIDVLRFVWYRMSYVSDGTKWNTPEYWQYARKSYDDRTGDCEDGAILILTLCRLAGIPTNRIFLTCGYVNYKGKIGGHAYVTYRSDNGVNYILDWSYFMDKRRIPNHKTTDDVRYETPWWFGNDGGFYK